MVSRVFTKLSLNPLQFSTNIVRSLNSLSLSKQGVAPPGILSMLAVKGDNLHIWRENDPIKLPVISNKIINLPTGLKYIPELVDPSLNKEIEVPSSPTTSIPLEAARLIVIRRKKMKKHKLRKLRKRMKYEWAKLRQRRELKKEKAFQAVLIQQCKDAETFSAEKYVAEKLEKLNYVRVPKRWKGKILPEAEIRKRMERMGLDPS